MISEPLNRGFDMSGPQEMDNEVTRLKVHIHKSGKAAISLPFFFFLLFSIFAICSLSVSIWLQTYQIAHNTVAIFFCCHAEIHHFLLIFLKGNSKACCLIS